MLLFLKIKLAEICTIAESSLGARGGKQLQAPLRGRHLWRSRRAGALHPSGCATPSFLQLPWPPHPDRREHPDNLTKLPRNFKIGMKAVACRPPPPPPPRGGGGGGQWLRVQTHLAAAEFTHAALETWQPSETPRAAGLAAATPASPARPRVTRHGGAELLGRADGSQCRVVETVAVHKC